MGEQDQKTHSHIWDPSGAISPGHAASRVDQMLARRGWRRVMKLILERKGAVSGLEVGELGCGTGTSSLVLALAGASVTLIDANDKVLEAARTLFASFGVPARFVRADLSAPVPDELRSAFDLVTSGGVAEHFTGDYRIACIRYHRELLRDGGIAVIGVPNRLSPFYRGVRAFRELTGTWELDIEAPFTNPELMSLAKQAGFKEGVVVGSESLARDAAVYGRGMVSAVVELLPAAIRDGARAWKRGREQRAEAAEDPKARIVSSFERAAAAAAAEDGRAQTLTDWFSAGIDLVGFL